MRFVNKAAADAYAGKTTTKPTISIRPAITGVRTAAVNTGRTATMIRPGVTMTPGERYQAVKLPSDAEAANLEADISTIGTPPKETTATNGKSNKTLIIAGAIFAGMLLLWASGALKAKRR